MNAQLYVHAALAALLLAAYVTLTALGHDANVVLGLLGGQGLGAGATAAAKTR